nr:uncharacterized protein LOC103348436 [Oryctolagus cuniculus]
MIFEGFLRPRGASASVLRDAQAPVLANPSAPCWGPRAGRALRRRAAWPRRPCPGYQRTRGCGSPAPWSPSQHRARAPLPRRSPAPRSPRRSAPRRTVLERGPQDARVTELPWADPCPPRHRPQKLRLRSRPGPGGSGGSRRLHPHRQTQARRRGRIQNAWALHTGSRGRGLGEPAAASGPGVRWPRERAWCRPGRCCSRISLTWHESVPRPEEFPKMGTFRTTPSKSSQLATLLLLQLDILKHSVFNFTSQNTAYYPCTNGA